MTQDRRVVMFGWADSAHIQRWIAGLTAGGYACKLVSLGGEPVEGIDATIYPRGRALNYIIRAPQAALAARLFKPGILHVHYALGFGVWGLMARVRPMVVSVWGSDIRKAGTSKAAHEIVRRVLHRADWITATSHYLADDTCRLYPEVQKKLSIIPFGVEIPETCPPFAENRQAVRLCFVKMHRLTYGPDVLIRAMEKVVQSNPRVELSVAGQGEMTNELRRMVKARDLEGHVSFVGYIPNYRIYQFIQEHDIMVMPSLNESFGVAAVETSACGRPVIATRVGGVPEVVLNGRTGILVPPGDVDALTTAILTLANDSATRQAMGQAAYEYARDNYSWSKSLDQMMALYDRITHEKKPSHSTL